MTRRTNRGPTTRERDLARVNVAVVNCVVLVVAVFAGSEISNVLQYCHQFNVEHVLGKSNKGHEAIFRYGCNVCLGIDSYDLFGV